MKAALFVTASVLFLGACDKSPKVDLKNASGNQVAAAVKQSGMMSGETMIEPGLWESKVTVAEMNIPGMPPEMANKMKASMAEHQREASRHCVTEAEVRKPKEDFFGADKSCRYEHFTMGGGKIDIAMVCKGEGSTRNTIMKGTDTPTTYSMDMSSTGSGGEGQDMSMKMHVDSKRVGECSAKEG
jgi:hypothetical protein